MNNSFVETMKMIKVEHSIFALPFALASAFIAANGFPSFKVLLLIIGAMIFARSAAMSFNRYLDADIDAKNPRTAMRSIPSGRLSRNYSLNFTIINSLLFILVTVFINQLAFLLSPLMLLILLGYSYTKRFTSYCHFILGIALGLAPIGAWVAVRGEIALIPIVLGVTVTLWTTGFDIIYACQDIDFDKQEKLFSIPAAIGINKSLILSRILHILMLTLLVFIGINLDLGSIYWLGLGLVIFTLFYEHSLVWGGNLQKVDMAFFTMNGIISLVFGLAVIVGVVIK